MASSDLDSFISFLSSNPEIQQSCINAATFNDVAAIAKANGFEVSGSDLVKFASTQVNELNDEQLASIAGGGTWVGTPDEDKNMAVAVGAGTLAGMGTMLTLTSMAATIK